MCLQANVTSLEEEAKDLPEYFVNVAEGWDLLHLNQDVLWRFWMQRSSMRWRPGQNRLEVSCPSRWSIG